MDDGSLEVTFAIKEKNRRLLTLEEDRRALAEELGSRDATIEQLREHFAESKAAKKRTFELESRNLAVREAKIAAAAKQQNPWGDMTPEVQKAPPKEPSPSAPDTTDAGRVHGQGEDPVRHGADCYWGAGAAALRGLSDHVFEILGRALPAQPELSPAV